MSPQSKRHPTYRFLVIPFLGVSLLEASLLVLFILYNKEQSIHNWTNRGEAVGALCALIGGIYLLLRSWMGQNDRRSMGLSVALNLITVNLTLLVGEVGARALIFARPTAAFGLPRGVLPRRWSEVRVANLELLSRANPDTAGSFLIHSPSLGWTVRPGATSADGLYSANLQSVRSPDSAFLYSDGDKNYTVALIGDSYTFGEGVAFEATWGSRLEERLGADFQVLNFGVPGYGVDQAYLRYLEDAAAYEPDLVIFGIISHDFFRTLAVYPGITFADWEMPFGKPRFVFSRNELEVVNLPLMNPRSVFSVESIGDLAHIELDPGYNPVDWEWHWYHHLYAIRLLLSAFPSWQVLPTIESDSVKSLNSAILAEFARFARQHDSRPLVIFFPSSGAGEFEGEVPADVFDIFESAGVDYLDTTECLKKLPQAQRLAADGIHYSTQANAVVSQCIYDYLFANHSRTTDRDSNVK